MENKEFKPTVQNQVDLNRSIEDLKKIKNSFITKKLQIQAELSVLKDDLANAKTKDQVTELALKRKEIMGRFNDNELHIKEVNDSISAKRKTLIAVETYLREEKRQAVYGCDITKALTGLKEKYTSFAADSTRVASMRTMAAKFANELEAIIN